MRIVYLSLYQAIFQYGIIAWGGTYENAIKPLTIQQNNLVRKCLDKNMLEGSTKLNYWRLLKIIMYIKNVIEHNMTSQIIILRKLLDKDSLAI